VAYKVTATLENNITRLNNEKKEVLVFSGLTQIADFASEKLMEISKKSIRDKGRFTVALSGGKTPVALYQVLAVLKKPLQWDKTHIFIVDERFVPPEDKESNFLMINQTLLKHINIPWENIHPISTAENTPEASAIKYEEDLISFFKPAQGEFPVIDLIILGIGEDGHTASLMPGTPSLRENRHMTTAVLPPDTSKKQRITLTLPVINNAEKIIFLASGRSKAHIIKEVIEAENSSLPAAMVRPKKGKPVFLLDEEAASLLSKGENIHQGGIKCQK